MEKNKNRTDLIAAGRKRLQQFRQKKDVKGNKSSLKPSNCELDSNAGLPSADEKTAVVLPQVPPDEEVSSVNDFGVSRNTSSSVPSSEDYRHVTNTDCVAPEPSSASIIPETGMVTTTLAASVGLLHEEEELVELNVCKEQASDSLVSHQVDDSIIVINDANSIYSGNLERIVSEVEESGHIHGADQVKDRGAIQGADHLSLQQVDKDSVVDLNDEAAAGTGTGVTEMEEPPIEVSLTMESADDFPASARATNDVKEMLTSEGDLISAQPSLLANGSSAVKLLGSSKVSEAWPGCQSLGSDSYAIERLKEQLYLTSCAKDIFLFQLDEQSKLQRKFDEEHEQLLHEVSSATNLVLEVRGRNESLCEELAKCKSDIEAALGAKEELERQLYAKKSEVVQISLRAEELQAELFRSREASLAQLAEIAENKALVATLQSEIHTLNGTFSSTAEEKNELVKEKAFLVHENEKLLTELVESKNCLKSLQMENANIIDSLLLTSEERKNLEKANNNIICENEKLLADLAECRNFQEVLQVENGKLNGNLSSVMEDRNELAEENNRLAILREKLSLELADCKNLVASLQMEHYEPIDEQKVANSHLGQLSEGNNRLSIPKDGQPVLVSSPQREPDDGIVDVFPVELLKFNDFDQSLRVIDFKGHLEEAEKVTQKLDDLIQELHSHSMSLSTGKMVSPGVSKLIHAFESRAHHEDSDEKDGSATENILYMEPFLSMKERTSKLRTVLKELLSDSESAIELLKREKDSRNAADVLLDEFKVRYEALKEHTNSCEAASVELDITYAFIKGHFGDIEGQKLELLLQYDRIRQHSMKLEAENSELVGKLGVLRSHISELESKMNETLLSSDEAVSSLSSQVDTLCKELAKEKLEHEQVLKSVRKLSAFVGSSCSTPEAGYDGDLNLDSGFVTVCIDAVIKFIKNLQENIEGCMINHEVMCNSLKDKVNEMQAKNELANGVLDNLHSKLEILVTESSGLVENSQVTEENENLVDPLPLDDYDSLMEQLAVLLSGRLQLETENKKLKSELIDRENDVEELKKGLVDLDAIMHLVERVEAAVMVEGVGFNSTKLESRLHYLISFLFQRYKEADEQLHVHRETSMSHEMELSNLQEQMESLCFLVVQHENEIAILKESLRQGMEDFLAVQAELQEKANELEQSEQRVSSIREKLSIAVSKGKGLIAQRDNLKQSLAATSSELEKYILESQLKDSRLQEVEVKLKTYSEAGERVEALESELSYIRNSATALRESFLLKDSLLQRIEEILEDLELPENFHSRDIIEKIDWLARSIMGNSLPLTDWDQKSSGGGGSCTDAGFVASDAWKEDMQQNQSKGDDLRKKYEELQSKFYVLAEQNDMLEQSLTERNHVVQRWEEILDRINMPLQLRSMEPEDRIEWLGSALSEAHHHCVSLQQKVDHLETSCATKTAELDEAKKRLSDFDTVLQAVTSEKEHLLDNVETLTDKYDKASQMVVRCEFENDKLQNEVTALQGKLSEKVEYYEFVNDKLRNEVTALQEQLAEKVSHCELIHGDIRRLEELVSNVLQGSVAGATFTGGTDIKCLEQLLQKLVEQYTTLSLEKSVVSESVHEHIIEEAGVAKVETGDLDNTKEEDAAVLRGELEAALHDLMCVKEERDRCLEINESLAHEVEALELGRRELQELLSQEEQKAASLREKLNVAVRKGKSLVQQRDSLKQTIDAVNNEVVHLKSEIKDQESSLSDYKQKIMYLSNNEERVKRLESETLVLRNGLADSEHALQEQTRTLSMIVDTLNGFDAGFYDITDPVEKLKQIEEKWHHLHKAMASSENDFRKSKRSAELLLVELNEVQERYDEMQVELAQANSKLSELSREREFAEASKDEAISRLEKLSSVHFANRNSQLSELMVIRSCFTELIEGFYGMIDLLGNFLSKQSEYLYNLEASMVTCLEQSSAPNTDGLSLGGPYNIFPTNLNREKFFSANSLLDVNMQECIDDNRPTEFCSLLGHQLQDFLKEICVFKDEFYQQSISLDERSNHLSEIVGVIRREVISQKQYFDSMKENIIQLKSIEKERDTESIEMRKNISLLYEACSSTIGEIENWRAQFVESNLTVGDHQTNLDSSVSIDCLSSEGCRTMVDRLLFVVKGLIHFQSEILEGSQKDLKATIMNLQEELREKDTQRERICRELVSQIKEAESAARSHLQDSQSANARLHDVEWRLKEMGEECNMLKQRIKEQEDGESTLKELDERVTSLNNVLVAKDQEVEALMHALDEEETQMEDLTNKILELEQVVQQKNLDLENLQASHTKAMKKLSITVSKFDELHHLSCNLLSEVEKLQLQLHERDDEISFLRQEVTRCTNGTLVANQMNNKRNSNEMYGLVTWLNSVVPEIQVNVQHFDDQSTDRANEYKELLQKQIGALLSQLEDLRTLAQSKDMLLQVQKKRVEDLVRKGESLEHALHEKDSQLSRLQEVGDFAQMRSSTSEIVEVEPVINKWSATGASVAPQVRSLRKVNNDQVAIAINTDPDSGDRLEDEDDDKAHGFKSLTTSRVVPRFTRPVTDMIDGLWVSCDRALMRQPALRLGVIIYWAVIHALLATFVV